MNSPMSTHVRMSIYLGECDRYHHQPLYRAVVERLHSLGVAGVTVLRGVEGYGADRRIHTDKVLRLSIDLPVIVIAVDEREKLEAVLPTLAEMVVKGLIVFEPVEIVLWRSGEGQTGGREREKESGG